MRGITFLLLILLTVLPSMFSSRTFYYDINSSSNRSREKLVITEKKGMTDYKWYRSDGSESYFVRYTNKIQIVEAVIPEKDTNQLRIVFDRGAGKIIWSGKIATDMPILTNAILDKTVFYIFTHVYPSSNEVIYFQMIQPQDVRVVDMYLKWDGTETLDLNGRTYDTIRYEFGVANPFVGMFWPYKYYYWYTKNNRKLVKHFGVEENLSNETITLFEK